MEKLKVYAGEMATRHLSGDSVISSIVFTVSTSDVPFAGTDANVYINCGSLGTYFLNTADEDDFEVGDTRNYMFESNFTLNELRKATIELGHDNTGKSPGWHVSNVSFHIKLKESSLTYLYKHWGEIGWLAKNEGPYFTTVVEMQEGS